MTLRDELKKIMEAAGKATPGNWMDDPECAPLRVFSDYIAPGRTAAVAPTVCETPWSRDGKQGKADAALVHGKARIRKPLNRTRICCVDGCGRPSKARKRCTKHYQSHMAIVRGGWPRWIQTK